MQIVSIPQTQSGQGPDTAPTAKAAMPAIVSSEARSGGRSVGAGSGAGEE